MFERFSRKSMAATGAALLAGLGVSGVAVAQSSHGTSQSPKVGSKSAKEAPGTEQSPASEQPGSEQPGSETSNNDGPGGHADEPGNPNADHQFQGQE
jgi:hypothetical protein